MTGHQQHAGSTPASRTSAPDFLVVAVGDPCCNARVQLGKREAQQSRLSQATETGALEAVIRQGHGCLETQVPSLVTGCLCPCPAHGELKNLAEYIGLGTQRT